MLTNTTCNLLFVNMSKIEAVINISATLTDIFVTPFDTTEQCLTDYAITSHNNLQPFFVIPPNTNIVTNNKNLNRYQKSVIYFRLTYLI